jgi:hypothetical protein
VREDVGWAPVDEADAELPVDDCAEAVDGAAMHEHAGEREAADDRALSARRKALDHPR